jgi:hypothetical protein
VSETRSEKIEIRVTPLEKAQIDERALAAGVKRSDYVRNRALCQPVAPASNEGAKQEHPRRSSPADVVGETVAAEIAESRLKDEAARDAFLARRVPQLVGAGRTTPVAEREAKREWDTRGA